MAPHPSEAELLDALDAHDALVLRCAHGQLTWAAFERAYDSFYPRYRLDGHESDERERALFAKHAPRLVLHREIWEQVLTRVTGDEHLPAASEAGFIGPDEAVRRLQALAAMHLQH